MKKSSLKKVPHLTPKVLTGYHVVMGMSSSLWSEVPTGFSISEWDPGDKNHVFHIRDEPSRPRLWLKELLRFCQIDVKIRASFNIPHQLIWSSRMKHSEIPAEVPSLWSIDDFCLTRVFAAFGRWTLVHVVPEYRLWSSLQKFSYPVTELGFRVAL